VSSLLLRVNSCRRSGSMLVDYSDSDEDEPTSVDTALPKPFAAASYALPPPTVEAGATRSSVGLSLPAPTNRGPTLGAKGSGLNLPPPTNRGRPVRKEIRLQSVLSERDASLNLEDAAQLPAGFFESAPQPQPSPADASSSAPAGSAGLGGLRALLPAPKNQPGIAGGYKLKARAAQPPAAVAAGGLAATPARLSAPALPLVNTALYAQPEAAAGVTGAYGACELPPPRAVHAHTSAAGPSCGPSGQAADAVPADFLEAERNEKVISISQDALKRSMGPARQYEIPKPAEDVTISANFYNRGSGELEQSYKPNKMQKRKHQINSLAFDCAAKSSELAMRASHGIKTKQQTQAKYGW